MKLPSLKSYFDRIKKKRFEKEAFNLVLGTVEKAICRADEPQDIAAIYTQLKASPLFGKGAKETLLNAALSADNVEAFSLIQPKEENPNYWFEWHMTAVEVSMASSHHILHEALSHKAEKIALALASDPRTDVTARGYSESRFYKNVDKYERDPLPVDYAHSQNMPAVEAVLAERMAGLYAQQSLKAQQKKSGGPAL